jgi:cyclic di-GMP phosphodiesterase
MNQTPELIQILIVNDDTRVVETIQASLPASRYRSVTATTGVVALELLKRFRFHVVLCVPSLPNIDGLDLLRRGLAISPYTAFLLMTDDLESSLALNAKRMGATSCLRKPIGCEELLANVEQVVEGQRLELEQEIFKALSAKTLRERTIHLHEVLRRAGDLHRSALELLVAALDSRENSTNMHSLRVREFSVLLARKCGYRNGSLKQFADGALLHDIGKIAIPESILFKPGALTPQEHQIVQHHAMFGYQVLSQTPLFEQAAQLALMHHERMDGKGYPMHLRGNSIPWEVRIFAVADTMDVITAGRPYREPRSMDEARAEIQRCSGTQFDPEIVDFFLSIPDEEWMAARNDVAKHSEKILSRLTQKTAFQSMPY